MGKQDTEQFVFAATLPETPFLSGLLGASSYLWCRLKVPGVYTLTLTYLFNKVLCWHIDSQLPRNTHLLSSHIPVDFSYVVHWCLPLPQMTVTIWMAEKSNGSLPAGPETPFEPGAPMGPLTPASPLGPLGPLGPGRPWDPGFPSERPCLYHTVIRQKVTIGVHVTIGDFSVQSLYLHLNVFSCSWVHWIRYRGWAQDVTVGRLIKKLAPLAISLNATKTHLRWLRSAMWLYKYI